MSHPWLGIALLVLVEGIFATWIFRAIRKRRSEMDRRFRLVTGDRIKAPAAEAPASSQQARDNAASASPIQLFFAFGAANTWGMRAGAPLLLPVAAFCAAGAWFALTRGFDVPQWSAILASVVAAYFGPRTVLFRQQQGAMQKFTDLFPDAVDMVSRLLRAGTPISYAIQVVGNEAQPPVNAVFAQIADQIRIGIPFSDALDAESRRVPQMDFRFFAVAAIMQYSTGGNLVSTLEELAQIMRKRHGARMKAKAITAEIRFSAYVLGSLPFLVTGALLVIDPGYLAPLLSSRRGHFIIATALGLLALAFITMRQMIRSISRE